MVNSRAFIVIVFFVTLYPSYSQKKIKLQQLSSANGLSQNTINCIYQDHKGFMWFGTHNGLNRYDAYSFKVFKNIDGNKSSIISNDIYSIYEDNDRKLWVGSRLGLSLYNRQNDTFTNYDFGGKSNFTLHPVWHIYPADENHLWLGASGGLFLFNKTTGKFKHYKVNDSTQNDNSIGSLAKDAKGNLWVATIGGGLWLFESTSGKFKKKPFCQDEIIRCIEEDSKGNIWVGSDRGIVRKFNYGQNGITCFKTIKVDFDIRSLLEDKKGNIWIGTDKGGVFVYDNKNQLLTSLEYEKENGNNVIRCIYEDSNRNMWLGTYNGGVFLYNHLNTSYNFLLPYPEIQNANESNSVLSIIRDKSGSVWLGTDGGGLIEFREGKKVKTYRKQAGKNYIPDDIILCIAEGPDDRLFIGTYSNGLLIFDKKREHFKNYSYTRNKDTGLNDNSVWALLQENNHLWIGTNNAGLNLMDLDEGKFKHFSNSLKNPKSLSSNTIRSIYRDSRYNLWVGTVFGLNLFNPKDSTFTHFFHDPKDNKSISNNNVLSIFEDSENTLWFGTHGGGLNKYDSRTNTFTCFNEENGLIGNIVYGILEDDNKFLWLSTNKGIFRYDPLTDEFKNFDIIIHGVYNSLLNIGGYYKSDTGEMFFGTTSGACSFYPDQIKINTTPPPVVLTDFMLFNKPENIGKGKLLEKSITETKKITLNHTQSVFTIVFAALNYTHPAKNNFSYKLEGFDKDWNYIGSRNSATYTNLEPGNYIFKVKASNNDNIWNETPTALNIIVTPPFWKTLWFKSSMTLLALLSIYAGYRIKVRRIKKQQIILKRIVDKKAREIEEKNLFIYETERQNALLMQQKLNHELNNKTKELTNYILLIIQKNQFINELKTKIKETLKTSAPEKASEFRKLLTTINLNFSPEKEWNQFYLNFNLTHSDFAAILKSKFPDLTKQDLRLCALYRIEISSLQISEVMGISMGTLKMARYRLRKKLNLPPEEDLCDYLKQI